MSPNDDHRFDDEERELDRLLAKAARRQRGAEDDGIEREEIRKAIEAQQQYDGADDVTAATLEFEKWRLLHKYIYARPFRLSGQQSRPDQWREVARRYATLDEPELAQWLDLQIEVAENRQQGRSDLRVRRDGPCFLILLEYVGNKKRTALAVLHWARQAQNASDVSVHSAPGINKTTS